MRRRNVILLGILMLGVGWIGRDASWAGTVSQEVVEQAAAVGTARVLVQLAVMTQQFPLSLQVQ
jgi:hypothetical protein